MLIVVLELELVQSFQTGLEVVETVVVTGLGVELVEEAQSFHTGLDVVVVIVVVDEELQSDQIGAAPLCCSAQWVTTSPMTVETSLDAQAATMHCWMFATASGEQTSEKVDAAEAVHDSMQSGAAVDVVCGLGRAEHNGRAERVAAAAIADLERECILMSCDMTMYNAD